MAAQGVKVDPNDPNVRKLVYNMYRGILGNYNDKANNYLNTLPKERVKEDQGITKQLESMIRQQSQISGGNTYVPNQTDSGIGFEPAPPLYPVGAPSAPPPPPPPPSSAGAPPPPPPPIGLVHIPAIRLRSEIPDVKREPPAAIQSAMMKDKKPFTYTPGGLDLSEIRSPRMQRRITKNAEAPDRIIQPQLQQTQVNRPVSLPPSAAAAMQPQIAIPVFPPSNPSPNVGVPPPPPPPINNIQFSPPLPSPVNNIQFSPPPPPPQPTVPKMQLQRQLSQNNKTQGSIYVPPIQQQQSQPRSQLGSLYIPPVQQQEPPASTPTPPPVAQLNKAPTPWLSRQNQPQKEVPPWVNREDNSSSPVTSQNVQTTQKQPQRPQQNQQQARIIPIQIEGREPTKPNTRVIPITIEGTPSPKLNIHQPNFQQQQHQQYEEAEQELTFQQAQQKFKQAQNQQQQNQQRWPVYVHNKFNSNNNSSMANENSNISNGRAPQAQQQNWVDSNDGNASPAPVQSRSFKVLQKITDSNQDGINEIDAPYNSQGVPLSQLRKLQLSDDDRAFMNKVKSQVSETILPVDDENPRYRGGYIPSRVFKALDKSVPQGPHDNQIKSTVKRHQQQEPAPQAQPYVRPSEQQVQEPRMYTGAAIPSRSFKMLQAMTGPDPTV